MIRVPPASWWPVSILSIVGNYKETFSRKNDQRVHKWKRPEARHVKLNVDASFHADEGSGATAAVLRDDKGRFIAAQCRYIQYAADVTTTEAMAMRDGLNLANTSGFNRVEAESDFLSVVNCCQGQNQWWDAAATVFAECIDIATLIGKVIFSHCFRKANSIAHELAKFSFSTKCETSWTNEPPGFLVSNDVILID